MTEAGAGLLPRPRLLSLLAESPARMVLLKAPPGFGKTALLQSYAAQRREAVVWVNCQQADNDPMCLANNLGRALLQQRLISPQALERQFNGFGIPSPELITDALLTLLQQPAPLTLVFNDIDQLLSPPSISLVARLLDECPPQARFFFSCKRSPQLPHSTYLLDQRMLLIGPEELAFTTDEAQQLLLQRAGFSADTAQLQQIQQLTQGWPAALAYLASHARDGAALAEILQDLQQGGLPLEAFFNEKVLRQQTPAAQQLLLKLSLLERFQPSLCHALVDAAASAPLNVGQWLEQTMFVARQEKGSPWHQFHPMFRSYLQSQAQQLWSLAEISALRLQAAEWLWQQGQADEAIELALLAGQYVTAAAWLALRSRAMVRQMGQMSRFVLLMARLPDSAIDPHPVLRQNYAWCLCLAKKYHAFDDQMQKIRSQRAQISAAEAQAAERGLELLECATAALRDNIRGVSSRIAQWLARWDQPGLYEDASEYHFETAVAYLVHGFCCKCISDFEQAGRSLLASVSHYDAYGSPYGKAWPRAILAVNYAKQGAHHEARSLTQTALEEVQQTLGSHSHAGFMLSALQAAMAYDAGELSELDPALQQSIKYLKEQGSTDPLIAAYQTVARLQVRAGQLMAALDTLREGIVFAEQAQLGRLKLSLLDELLCWLLRDGRSREAARYVDMHTLGFGGSQDFSSSLAPQRITARAHINWLLLEQRFASAIDILHQLVERSRVLKQGRNQAEWLMLLAVAQQLAGDAHTALLSLQESLDIARSQCYRRLYLDQSPRVLAVLRQLFGELRDSRLRSFVQPLLAALLPQGHAPTLYEMLTGKELDIIALLQQGLDNKQLATALSISEGTLKWHLHNIFGKLQVRNRTQAVQVSRQHGLIK
jgi:LuxR family maltose regulon positive regulatory protein